jgi:hypothetical protein
VIGGVKVYKKLVAQAEREHKAQIKNRLRELREKKLIQKLGLKFIEGLKNNA